MVKKLLLLQYPMVEERLKPSIVREYRLATQTLIDNLKTYSNDNRFGHFAFAALDYLSRISTGKGLPADSKNFTMAILTIGTQINDYYDTGKFNPRYYSSLLRSLKRKNPERYEDFKKYRKETSRLEKKRPDPRALIGDQERKEKAIIKYREGVDRLSLSFCCSVAFDKPFEFFFEKGGPPWFESFFHLVMASQVIDDYVGRRGDLAFNRPSFYTMLSSPQEAKTRKNRSALKKKRKMIGLYIDYVRKSQDNCPSFMAPIRSAVIGMAIYPSVADLIKAFPLPEKLTSHIMSRRDIRDL